jgi:hypothetical protein
MWKEERESERKGERKPSYLLLCIWTPLLYLGFGSPFKSPFSSVALTNPTTLYLFS